MLYSRLRRRMGGIRGAHLVRAQTSEQYQSSLYCVETSEITAEMSVLYEWRIVSEQEVSGCSEERATSRFETKKDGLRTREQANVMVTVTQTVTYTFVLWHDVRRVGPHRRSHAHDYVSASHMNYTVLLPDSDSVTSLPFFSRDPRSSECPASRACQASRKISMAGLIS
jgi:hypothetical protein